MPLTTAVGRRMMRVPIPPDSDPRRFIPRVEIELLQKAKPILAFAVRTEVALGNRWDSLARNLEHLGSHRGVRFVTATAALAEMERPALLARSAP
jgi:hypothetical protein